MDKPREGSCVCARQGATFEQLCKMTDIFEGSIIRATRRLDELMRQLVNAMSVQ